MKKILLCTALLAASTTAEATPARMAALSGNGGFADDTDFFLYPSVLGGLIPRTMLTYNGGFDGGLIFDDGQALWFERDSVAGDVAGLGPQGGYRAVYAKGDGASGYLLRGSQTGGDPTAGTAGTLTLGGGWSKGEGGYNTNNLAINGDLSIIGKLTDEPTVGINAGIGGRDLTEDKLVVWGAGVGYASDVLTLSGGYTTGPRFRNDLARVALQVGPLGAISVNTNNDAKALGLSLPFSNLAAEYSLREWVRLRGSATAALLAVTDIDDFVDSMVWGASVGGAFGVGLIHESARLDMSINPDWVLGGPNFLSGTSNQMFGTVTARVDL
ncbi:MAG: hypothetical protein ACI8RZ_001755 [Myxococcota bacterium]|jgi:hypothetical protein